MRKNPLLLSLTMTLAAASLTGGAGSARAVEIRRAIPVREIAGQRPTFAVRMMNTFLTVFRGDEGRTKMMVSALSNCLGGMRASGTEKDFLEFNPKVGAGWILGQVFSKKVDANACGKIISKILSATAQKGESPKPVVAAINLFVRQFNALYGPAARPVERDAAYVAFRGMAEDAIRATHGKANLDAYQEASVRFMVPAAKKLMTDASRKYFAEIPALLEKRVGQTLPAIPEKTLREIPDAVEALIEGRQPRGVRSSARFAFNDGVRQRRGSLEDCITQTRSFPARKDCFVLAARALDEPVTEWTIDHLPVPSGPLGVTVRNLQASKAETYGTGGGAKGALAGTEASRFDRLIAGTVSRSAGDAIPDAAPFADAKQAVVASLDKNTRAAIQKNVQGSSYLDRGQGLAAKAGTTASDAALSTARDRHVIDQVATSVSRLPIGFDGAHYDVQLLARAIAGLTGVDARSQDPTPVRFVVADRPPATLIECLETARKRNELPMACGQGFAAAVGEPAAKWAALHFPDATDLPSVMLVRALRLAATQALGPDAPGGSERARVANFARLTNFNLIDDSIARAKTLLVPASPERSDALDQAGRGLKASAEKAQAPIFAEYLAGNSIIEIGQSGFAHRAEIAARLPAEAMAESLANDDFRTGASRLAATYPVGPDGAHYEARILKANADAITGQAPMPANLHSPNIFDFGGGKPGTLKDCLDYSRTHTTTASAPLAHECLEKALRATDEAMFEAALKSYPDLLGGGAWISDALHVAGETAYATNPDGSFIYATERDRLVLVLARAQQELLRRSREPAVAAVGPKPDDLRDWDTTPVRRAKAMGGLFDAIDTAIPTATRQTLDTVSPPDAGVSETAQALIAKNPEPAALAHVRRVSEAEGVRPAAARVLASLALGPSLEQPFVEAVAHPEKPSSDPLVADLARRFARVHSTLAPASLVGYPKELNEKIIPAAASELATPIFAQAMRQIECASDRPELKSERPGFYDCGCSTRGGQYVVKGGGLAFSDETALLINLMRMAWNETPVKGGESCASSISRVLQDAASTLAGHHDYFASPLAPIAQAIQRSRGVNPPVINCVIAGAVHKYAEPAIDKVFKNSPTPYLDHALSEASVHEALSGSPETQKALAGLQDELQGAFLGKTDASGKKLDLTRIVSQGVQSITAGLIRTKPVRTAIASELMTNSAFSQLDLAENRGFARAQKNTLQQGQLQRLLQSPRATDFDRDAAETSRPLTVWIAAKVGDALSQGGDKKKQLTPTDFLTCQSEEAPDSRPTARSLIVAAGQVQKLECTAGDSAGKVKLATMASDLQDFFERYKASEAEVEGNAAQRAISVVRQKSHLLIDETALTGGYVDELEAFRRRNFLLYQEVERTPAARPISLGY
jgi:hypothetical protein